MIVRVPIEVEVPDGVVDIQQFLNSAIIMDIFRELRSDDWIIVSGNGSKRFTIDGHDFTCVKNITGTGGYVLCCQTPEPKFICTCDYFDAERQAKKYLRRLENERRIEGLKERYRDA